MTLSQRTKVIGFERISKFQIELFQHKAIQTESSIVDEEFYALLTSRNVQYTIVSGKLRSKV